MLRKKGYIDKYNLNIYSLKLELQLRITLQRAKINEAIYLNYVAICDLERYIRSCYILTMMFGRGARMCVYFCFNYNLYFRHTFKLLFLVLIKKFFYHNRV